MTTYQRTRSDAKKAARNARKGQKLYVIKAVATNIAAYEDSHLYDEYEVTHRQQITGAWMISGSLSVEGLVLRDGPVYTSPPPKIRNIATPGRQYAAPPGGNRVLDEAELRGLTKQNREARQEQKRAGRRGWL